MSWRLFPLQGTGQYLLSRGLWPRETISEQIPQALFCYSFYVNLTANCLLINALFCLSRRNLQEDGPTNSSTAILKGNVSRAPRTATVMCVDSSIKVEPSSGVLQG